MKSIPMYDKDGRFLGRKDTGIVEYDNGRKSSEKAKEGEN